MAELVDREFRVEPLGKEHDRAVFSCGVENLDRYLRTRASQDMRRKANAVFVLLRSDVPAAIVGYFTLCATTLSQNAMPEKARKHLPRYPLVSATLIGRLATVTTRAPALANFTGCRVLAGDDRGCDRRRSHNLAARNNVAPVPG